MFPIDDKAIRDRVLGEILGTQLADNVKARVLLADGSYERVTQDNGAGVVRSQDVFVALARKRSQTVAAPRAHEDTPSGGTFIALAKPNDPHAKPAVVGTSRPLLVS
jgi:hypothetical protein